MNRIGAWPPRPRLATPIRAATRAAVAAVGIAVAGAALPSLAAERPVVVASTTSTEVSGLFELILPRFTAETGIRIQAVAVGTGQAIGLAKRGDADVLFVHDRTSEEAFVAGGDGVERFEVMHNEFLLVGPKDDPAAIRGGRDAAEALRKIAESRSPFASRGDDSGTHKAELRLWQAAGIDPVPASGTWYRETGAGQGATINTAAGMNAYVLVDRGTWLATGNRGDLETLVAGDARLHNPYGIILVNPKKHPHVRAKDGQAFIDWILSTAGQAAVGSLQRRGVRLFTPAAQRLVPAGKRIGRNEKQPRAPATPGP